MFVVYEDEVIPKLFVKDVINSSHIKPGTRLKVYSRIHVNGNTHSEVVRNAVVLKEYPKWLLVDFGPYVGTISKVDILIGRQRIEIVRR